MVKKAILVDFSIRTRALVDLPEDQTDLNEDENYKKISEIAIEKIFQNGIIDYLSVENIDSVEEDMELPYGSCPTDDDEFEKFEQLKIEGAF